MAVTILEALENAQFNLVTQRIPGVSDIIGAEQLKNAIGLLGKGYGIYDQIEQLLDKYGSLEQVPDVS